MKQHHGSDIEEPRTLLRRQHRQSPRPLNLIPIAKNNMDGPDIPTSVNEPLDLVKLSLSE